MMKKDIENLYQKNKQESPPNALDSFIINQARSSNEVNNKSEILKKWLFPLSTAAVVVMSFSVILNLQHENEYVNEQLTPNPILIKKSEGLSSLQTARTLSTEKEEVNKAQSNRETREIKEQELIYSSTPSTYKADSTDKGNKNNLLIDDSLDTIEENESPFKPTKKLLDEPLSESGIVMASASIEATDSNTLKDNTINISPAPIEQKQLGALDKKENTKKSSLKNKPLSKLENQLNKLHKLIEDKKFNQAKDLLTQLKKLYPNNDFSKLEQLLISTDINN